jgi:hypothetical protein
MTALAYGALHRIGALNHESFGFIIESAIGDRAETISGTRQMTTIVQCSGPLGP